MDEGPKLTARQQQILDLVQSAIERTGAPPTRAEIAAELGFARPTPPKSTCRRWRARASSNWSVAPRAASA
jgi:SOS-response transcriptional repressor LexA